MSGPEPGVDVSHAGRDPEGRLTPLVKLTIALVLGMSTWFSATAVIPQLTVHGVFPGPGEPG